MLVVETIGKIRRAYFVQGKPIKAICRELKVSRKVVRKVLRSGATSFEYEREVQPLPKIGPWKADLERILAANAAKPARERLTLMRVFEELRGLGYQGGYDAVRRYARSWHREQAATSAAAFVPLSFAPGEAYQFDWSHEVVLINGTTVIVKVAHVRLCHSRMMFVRAYPRETQEMVFDAHDRAFAFFKGACTRGIYDNMKTAVEAILVGKERAYNRRFLQMCGHYLVEPVACTPASGWEKGQVENQVGLVRERFFSPRLRVKSYEELNAWLLDKCIAYAKAHRHPELRDRTIWEVFEAERPSLVAYAGRFDGFHAVPASVARTCLVRFDNNRYSVAANAVGRPVEIRAYADRIELRQEGRIVGEHRRSFGRDQTVYVKGRSRCQRERGRLAAEHGDRFRGDSPMDLGHGVPVVPPHVPGRIGVLVGSEPGLGRVLERAILGDPVEEGMRVHAIQLDFGMARGEAVSGIGQRGVQRSVELLDQRPDSIGLVGIFRAGPVGRRQGDVRLAQDQQVSGALGGQPVERAPDVADRGRDIGFAAVDVVGADPDREQGRGEIGRWRELIDLPYEPGPVERVGVAGPGHRPAPGPVLHGGDRQLRGEIVYPHRTVGVAGEAMAVAEGVVGEAVTEGDDAIELGGRRGGRQLRHKGKGQDKGCGPKPVLEHHRALLRWITRAPAKQGVARRPRPHRDAPALRHLRPSRGHWRCHESSARR